MDNQFIKKLKLGYVFCTINLVLIIENLVASTLIDHNPSDLKSILFFTICTLYVLGQLLKLSDQKLKGKFAIYDFLWIAFFAIYALLIFWSHSWIKNH